MSCILLLLTHTSGSPLRETIYSGYKEKLTMVEENIYRIERGVQQCVDLAVTTNVGAALPAAISTSPFSAPSLKREFRHEKEGLLLEG